jgi:hypothetical protein
MVYQPRLLCDQAALVEDSKIGNAADVESRCQLRVTLGIHLDDDGPPSHLCGRASDLWGRGTTGAAPSSPEIHQYGDARVFDNVVELLPINFERLIGGR